VLRSAGILWKCSVRSGQCNTERRISAIDVYSSDTIRYYCQMISTIHNGGITSFSLLHIQMIENCHHSTDSNKVTFLISHHTTRRHYMLQPVLPSVHIIPSSPQCDWWRHVAVCPVPVETFLSAEAPDVTMTRQTNLSHVSAQKRQHTHLSDLSFQRSQKICCSSC
jgi:hypothetical protein